MSRNINTQVPGTFMAPLLCDISRRARRVFLAVHRAWKLSPPHSALHVGSRRLWGICLRRRHRSQESGFEGCFGGTRPTSRRPLPIQEGTRSPQPRLAPR
jgi:hypothetical protein